MRKSPFTEQHPDQILRATDGAPVSLSGSENETSQQTPYQWHKRFGGMDAHDAKRLKQLEAENLKLKKMLADRLLEIDVLKEVASRKW